MFSDAHTDFSQSFGHFYYEICIKYDKQMLLYELSNDIKQT